MNTSWGLLIPYREVNRACTWLWNNQGSARNSMLNDRHWGDVLFTCNLGCWMSSLVAMIAAYRAVHTGTYLKNLILESSVFSAFQIAGWLWYWYCTPNIYLRRSMYLARVQRPLLFLSLGIELHVSYIGVSEFGFWLSQEELHQIARLPVQILT